MGKKILDSKLLYIVISIALAISLWFYVTSLDGNESTATIRNIPVTFAGEDILEERGLMIVSTPPTATVEVKATPSVLAKLNDKTITLSVNVSQITEAAEYRLAYTASLPSGVSQSDVEFISGQTGNVSFTVARFTSREVEIRGEFAGTVADGYLPGESDDFIFAPKTVTISGQANQVNQVDHVLVTVGGEKLTDTINGNYTYQLIGVSGEPLDLDVSCSEEFIYVTYPIWATKEIELAVKFTTGGGVTGENIDFTMSADRITVAGTKEAIAAISDSAITLATINLAAVSDGDELTYQIPLADELTNISGITEVTVTIDLPDYLETETISVSEISFVNIPDGFTPVMITKILPVEIRGIPTMLADLTEENVRVVADLSNINATAGQYTVPVKIYLNTVGTAAQIGVLGTDYRVVISLVQDQADGQNLSGGQE